MENFKLIFIVFLFFYTSAYSQFRYNLSEAEITSAQSIVPFELEEINSIIKSRREKLEEVFGKIRVDKPRFVIYGSTDEFTREHNTVWQVGGIYFRGVIHIQPVSSLRIRGNFETIIANEYTHHFLSARFKDMPFFMKEGMSAYFAGLPLRKDYPLSVETMEARKEEVFTNYSFLEKFVSGARYFVAFILENFGTDGLIEILEGDKKQLEDLYREYYFLNSAKAKVLLPPVAERRFTVSSEGIVDTVITLSDGRIIEKKLSAESIHIETVSGGIFVNDTAAIRAHFKFRDSFSIQGRAYRGKLEIIWTPREIRIVNILPVEYYLYGTVASEMPSENPVALELQSILSRSLAYYRIHSREDSDYNLSAFTIDQSYRGMEWETRQAREAVIFTEGLVMKFAESVVLPYYSSTCAGHTAYSEDVWNEAKPYLKSIDCRNDEGDILCAKSPHFGEWENSITQTRLSEILGEKVFNMEIAQTNHYGRVKSLKINGRIFGFDAFKSRVGREEGWFFLKSNLFELKRDGDTYIFKGRGLGHGVGLCQYGAMELAETSTVEEIANFYFDNVDIRFIQRNYSIWK